MTSSWWSRHEVVSITLDYIAHHFVRIIHVSESESAEFLLSTLLIICENILRVITKTSPDSEHTVHHLWSWVPGDTRRVHRGVCSSRSWTFWQHNRSLHDLAHSMFDLDDMVWFGSFEAHNFSPVSSSRDILNDGRLSDDITWLVMWQIKMWQISTKTCSWSCILESSEAPCDL